MRSTSLLLFLLCAIAVRDEPLSPCADSAPEDGKRCNEIVANLTECQLLCSPLSALDCFADGFYMEDGQLNCTIENIRTPFESYESDLEQLSEYIKNQSSPAIAPFAFANFPIHAYPLAAKITEVNEKDQAVSFMIMILFRWTDYRLRWNSEQYGGIDEIAVTRESIWRPPIFPLNMISFSSEDTVKSNVKIHHSGRVSDTTVWNFKKSVYFELQAFPFDKHSIDILLTTTNYGIKISGTQYLKTRTRSPTEWKIIEDFEKVESSSNILTYRVTIKRYHYFWLHLVIIPCFLLGHLVIAALTLGADSNSVEALINIGLAASVSSAVVVNTMTDHFPKTEDLASIATFVQQQFFIIVAVLITLSLRKAAMTKIEAKLHEWKTVKRDEEQSILMKLIIKTVTMLKHQLCLFFLFGIVYTICFILMLSDADFQFEGKKRVIEDRLEDINIFEGNGDAWS